MIIVTKWWRVIRILARAPFLAMYSKILVFFNQILKTNQKLQTPNDSIPNSSMCYEGQYCFYSNTRGMNGGVPNWLCFLPLCPLFSACCSLSAVLLTSVLFWNSMPLLGFTIFPITASPHEFYDHQELITFIELFLYFVLIMNEYL